MIAAKDVHLCLLQAAAILKLQILVIRLNRECGDHAVVRLAEEIDPQIEIQRIVVETRPSRANRCRPDR